MNICFILFAALLFFGNITFAQPVGDKTGPTAAPAQTAEPTLGQAATPEWKPKLNWSGDIRYRLARSKEDIDDERTFQQLRVRLGLRADVNETTQAVIRLATATSAISTNQTLGDSSEPGMARRPFGIDLAYIDFKFLANQGGFWIGRTANPYWAPAKIQMIFDSDLAFEGFALKFEPKWEHAAAFINLGGFIVSENYTAPEDKTDSGLVGGDLGFILKDKNWSWTSHFGNYYYLGIKDHVIGRVEKDAKIDVYSNNPNERFRGNTVYVNDPLLPAADRKYFYQNEYILLELGSEWKHKLGDVEYTLYIDAVNNDAAPKEGHALEAGANVKWRRLTLGYAHVKKEADSVLSSFTDSDTNGGGTGNRGERMLVNFALNKNASFQMTHFRAKRGIDVVARKFEMTHVDLMVGF